jgi:2-dehydro-3-deoxyphosphogluconate aldolase / (4S)-4-hydroxy-2-oxoglutarate aldolase
MTSRAEIVARLREARVLPVVTVDDVDQAVAAATALAAGGLGCVEIAFRTEAAAEALARVNAVDGVLAGAGTILSAEQAVAARDAGAAFAVAPGLNETVVAACAELDLPFFPGVATPSEIERARTLGLDVLKVFPAQQLGGPAFLRAVTPTYPDVGFLPTGGITQETLADYLAVPSVVACGGSWMVKPDLLRAGRFGDVERLARAAVAVAA